MTEPTPPSHRTSRWARTPRRTTATRPVRESRWTAVREDIAVLHATRRREMPRAT